jgi:UDP-N-acetyl-D-glucosamine dehydrogenase
MINTAKWKTLVDGKKIIIGVIGGGVVGLSVASLFAKNGFKVVVYDIDKDKVERINRGENHIPDEEWMDSEIKKCVDAGRLNASSDVGNATVNDVIFIDVPTTKGENFEPTSEFIIDVCKTIGKTLRKDTLIILESTVILGETENQIRKILENESGLICGKDFGLVFSPERLNPGDKKNTIWNIPKVVGGIDETSGELASYLYGKVITTVIPVTNPRTAEFVKLMELSQRAALLAHIFEMRELAEKYRINMEEAINAARTKWNFIPVNPSCGVGGYCVKPAVKSLIKAAKSVSSECNLLDIVNDVIENMPIKIARDVAERLKDRGKEIKNSKIGIIGITYKEGISDPKASAVETLVKELTRMGAPDIVAYDPKSKNNVNWVNLTGNLEDVFDADCVIICTKHDEFKTDSFRKRILDEQQRKNFILVDSKNSQGFIK